MTLAPRPRIWMNPALLATLKARALRNSPSWLNLKDLVDRPGQDWDVNIPNYALAYVVTGDAAYSAKAWNLMSQSLQAGLSQVTPDSGYPCRSYFLAGPLAFDWLYPALTLVQRDTLRVDLETNWRWVWPETNPSRAGAWSITDPGDNYFHGFLMSWLAGVALSGDSTQAQAILDLSMQKWTSLVLPYLNGPAAGGYFCEGCSYGIDSVRLMALYLLGYSTGTGDDLYSRTDWVRLATTAIQHLTVPTMDAIVPLGDMTKGSGGPLRDPARTPMLIAASRGDTDAKAWLKNTVPNQMQERANTWESFLWGDD